MNSIYFSLCYLIVFIPVIAVSLSCSEVKEIGTGARFTLEDLETLKEEDYQNCLVFLGKDPLGEKEAKYLWDTLIQIYQGVPGIPESELRQIGWIAKSIPVKDIWNLTLGDIDTIAAFGIYHNLSHAQLEALAEQVRDDWGSKEPSEYTFYDLMALKHLLCGFNKTAIEEIHPDSYKEAANVLATLQGCSKEALEALASLATSDSAFGNPSTWTSSQVKSVGCVLNGLPGEVISSIPPQGIDSLTPDIVPCLLKETLRAMSPSQLLHLTPSAAAVMTSEQRAALDSGQQKAVDEAYEGKSDSKKSGTEMIHPDPVVLIIILLQLIINKKIK